MGKYRNVDNISYYCTTGHVELTKNQKMIKEYKKVK